jgi:hypothetical protein
MKILIASTPATGHLNPLLAIGRILIAEGHEVAFLAGSALRSCIETIGAIFHAFPAGADFDLRDFASVAPELKVIAPGRNGCVSPWSAYPSIPSLPNAGVCSRFCGTSRLRSSSAMTCCSGCCRCC